MTDPGHPLKSADGCGWRPPIAGVGADHFRPDRYNAASCKALIPAVFIGRCLDNTLWNYSG